MPKNQATQEEKPRAAAAAAAAAAADIILEAMVDGVVITDLDGNIIQENKAYPKMYGYQTLVGKNITELVAKEDLPRVLEEIKKMTAGIASKNLEFLGITQDGKRFSVLFNGTILKDKKGGVVGILGVLRDITELKKAQEEINAEKIRINATLQNLNEGVVAFDANGNVILVNPMITKLTGLPEKGFSIGEFIRLFKGVDVEAKIKSALVNRQKTHIEEVTLIGRFFYEMFFTPIIDSQNNTIGSAIIINDITHIKEIERMKTEFVAVASHQLRTPLTAIKLFIEMLANEEVGKLNTQQRDYMENVRQSTERMVRLVNDLLNVSRLETGRLKIEPELIQLVEFIQNIIDEADPVAKDKKCRLVFKKPEEKPPKIPIDPSLMRQVVHNLVMNAILYSPVKQCDVLIRLEQKDHDYLVSVKDSGIGIPEDKKSRIFEKFFRADNAQKAQSEGSGLGLYVAKMIVDTSGGKIWFESPPKGEKNGTIFYVSLPAKGMKAKEGEKGLANNES